MIDQKLNSLALASKSGSEQASWELIHYFSKLIYRLSDASRNELDQARFEDACFKSVIKAALNFDPRRASFRTLATKSIYRELSKHKKRFESKARYKVHSDYYKTDGGDCVYFQHADEVNVEDDVILRLYVRDKVARLAAGDPRNSTILTAWSKGLYCDTELAARLSDLFGGKSESHRKKIQRFRIECQTALAGAI